MRNELAFGIAAGVSLLLSGLVILYLHRPLYRILGDLCGTPERGGFWTALANIQFLLVPLVAVMLGRTVERTADSFFFLVVEQAKWSLLGLIAATFLVALGVAAFVGPSGILVTRPQVDDLQRLLAKVEEIRAREIVSRTTYSEGPTG